PRHVKEVAEAQAATRALREDVMTWEAHLERDLAGVDLSLFRNHSSRPDDVIEATTRVIATVELRVAEGDDAENDALSYAEPMLAELRDAQAKAIKERDEAQDLLATIQEDGARVREAGIALQQSLIGVRQTLRNALGR